MIFYPTKLKEVFIIEPEPFKDERGAFFRNFCFEEFAKRGIKINIVQINRSFNKTKGTVRGFHYQKPPKAEDKIVQCIRGKLYDVALDIRENSPTYGQWVAEELTEDNKKMLLIPKGFAHGIQTLTDNCELIYFVSEFYSPECECGIRWNDSAFNVSWPLGAPTVISEKDKNWPLVKK